MTYEDVMKNEDVRAYIKKADETLKEIGYTEHSFAHVGVVASRAAMILSTLGFSEHVIELAKIAAGLHDIGNLINRTEHAQSGALMALNILSHMNLPAADIGEVIAAIGNHDEGTGAPVSDIAAALVLADKSDVRRSRVRNSDIMSFDQHDRVNYSVTKTDLSINRAHTKIDLFVEVDEEFCTPVDYFEIFMGRMIMCRKAALKLGLQFGLVMNGTRMM
ncbi:MAG: HD domain-containing protein [Clostridia bacterium]|nr:HD domain-containing protein [Clostridia bacterium]